jgi:hypothetical protein
VSSFFSHVASYQRTLYRSVDDDTEFRSRCEWIIHLFSQWNTVIFQIQFRGEVSHTPWMMTEVSREVSPSYSCRWGLPSHHTDTLFTYPHLVLVWSVVRNNKLNGGDSLKRLSLSYMNIQCECVCEWIGGRRFVSGMGECHGVREALTVSSMFVYYE